jgi:diguanylate cyclase (GGDEF)-like protein/excisionase family DNA binding protein
MIDERLACCGAKIALMIGKLKELPRDAREQTAGAIRDHEDDLIDDISDALEQEQALDMTGARDCARGLLGLLTRTLADGELDSREGALDPLCRFSPPLGIRQLLGAVDRAERLVLDELALHERLGVTSEAWPLVAHALRTAMLEIIAAFAERDRGRAAVRDQLTTLMTRHVFNLVLEQETFRAHRHKHGVAMMLFDIDDMARLNRAHGYGAGDRLLERLGILGRQFFRVHDWVARYDDDCLAVLLPQATLDQAASLASSFADMVQKRLVLVDHRTDLTTIVTVSAAAVGTDLVEADINPMHIMSEAEAAVLRAKMSGGNRVERVALFPTSVTIVGAATLIGTTPREIVRLLRNGTLRATRRGRHFHIDRSQLDDYRARRA